MAFGLTIYAVLLAGLFFTKRRVFPFHCTLYLSISIAYALLEAVVMHTWQSDPAQATTSAGAVFTTLAWSALWILYLRGSRRVGATFVRG
ncbi:DUF2569 family protein [Pendulispora brunnea]|uniref:DUF2569 family protein n=1 Tax=Pendulispora brunnea TaxID=2905690 RepID=UPI00374DFCE1